MKDRAPTKDSAPDGAPTVAPLAIDAPTLARWVESRTRCLVVDVREPWERDICCIDHSLFIPMGELPDRLGELPRGPPFVIYCHHGGRSIQAVLWLRRIGFPNAVNLDGGIEAWAVGVDPAIPTY